MDLVNVNLQHAPFAGTDKYEGCALFVHSETNLSKYPYSSSRQEAKSQTAISRGAEEKETATVDTCFQVSDAINMRLEAR